jgi:hypothetical protein
MMLVDLHCAKSIEEERKMAPFGERYQGGRGRPGPVMVLGCYQACSRSGIGAAGASTRIKRQASFPFGPFANPLKLCQRAGYGGTGMGVAIFIDTNQYLKLYGVMSGKELLEALEEQKKYIFVSRQIVDEVMRNKLSCAEKFLSTQFKQIDETLAVVPDHLLAWISTETNHPNAER